MKNYRIVMFGIVIIGIISCLSFSKVYANELELSYDYTATAKKYPDKSLENGGTYAKIAYANTRPTSGQSGVSLTIEYYDGRIISSGVFPYHTSRSDLTGTVPGSNIARVGIRPVGSERVSGTLHYGWK